MAMVPVNGTYSKHGYSERYSSERYSEPPGTIDYYGDRVYYQGPSAEVASYGAGSYPGKGTKWGPCVVIMAILFFLLILIIVVCLIIFFTVGRGAIVEPALAQRAVLGPLSNPRKTRGHNDFITPEVVLDSVLTGKRLCLFDTAYLAEDYAELFERERIKTSRHFDIEKVAKAVKENGVVTKRRSLVHPIAFGEYARSHGVTEDCHVVVYDHGEKDNSIIAATYVWWLFKVFGHPKVSIMHGGLREWKARQYPLTAGPAVSVTEGNMKAQWRPEWITTFDDALAAWKNGSRDFVDARVPDQYSGKKKHILAKRAGTIPGAVNIPTRALTNDKGAFKNLEDLKAIFEEKKLSKTRDHVVFCNSGLQASAVYFALVQSDYYGSLYDGSWIEWSWKVD